MTNPRQAISTQTPPIIPSVINAFISSSIPILKLENSIVVLKGLKLSWFLQMNPRAELLSSDGHFEQGPLEMVVKEFGGQG